MAKKTRPTLKPKTTPKSRVGKRSKPAKTIAKDRTGKIADEAQRRNKQAISRRVGAQGNASARLAFNAARRAQGDNGAARLMPIEQRSFDDLRGAWLSALSYLSKLGRTESAAPDVIAAYRRLEQIELEWERRSHLQPSDPEYFEWPSTDAPKGIGAIGQAEWEEVGILAYLGYHVGRTSKLSAHERTVLLSQIFRMRLPPLNSIEYVKQWSVPQSSARLKKMAETIASLARNAKRRRYDRLTIAIQDWEHDLSHLRETFYVGQFSFGWPQV